jgi:hypothetical protein
MVKCWLSVQALHKLISKQRGALHNNALQRTVDAPARGALRRFHCCVPPRAVCGWRSVAERDR